MIFSVKFYVYSVVNNLQVALVNALQIFLDLFR